MSTTDSNDVVSHGINAAQASAEDSKSQEQVEQLSAELQEASTTSQTDESSTQQ
ncbi:hypothetical protein GK047_18465 [Paenibacillus sp. SYP-B3998]|uniref:Uncharacterized protein n=1 Tax=Paenibacillus sp. SYP-B3998 TaxID=2678564 RepID=A0A6G4A2V9_9BACL|nr:hypothetical protein [Paenibacillus sp. SYP-B3998]NEW07987.1 hypothetical protein [Paenibacillus sp. SYP-B3998]